MPNIIEQQDLLKGLPDNRLAMMMQNPSGDIPPFLVAAEAQRRQAIRAQFSGGPQESVVDTLTKQMTSVPQNIQAPAQIPPRMPPPQMPQQMPPQAAGVAALQQGMRDGGMVQRYQSLGLVTPLQTRIQDIADQWGVTVEQAAEMMKNNPSLSGTLPPSEYGSSLPIIEKNIEAIATPSFPDLPVINISPADYAIKQKEAAREAKYQEMDSYPGYSGPSASMGSSAGYDPLSSIRTRTASPARTASPERDPRDPKAGQDDSSEANKLAAREAELRKRQEALYGSAEMSGSEKAQKWYAAAQAAIEPGQTNTQAVINALAALGSGYAQENAAKREAKTEQERAMLQWDLARYEGDRAAAASAASDALQYKRDIDKLRLQDELTGKREINKLQTLSPNSAIDGINAQMKILGDELADPSLDEATRKAKQAQLDSLSLMLAQIMNRSGYSVGSVPTIEEMRRLAAGQ